MRASLGCHEWRTRTYIMRNVIVMKLKVGVEDVKKAVGRLKSRRVVEERGGDFTENQS